MRLSLFTILLLFNSVAFAIGDSIGSSEGAIYFLAGIVIAGIVCIAIVVYFCLKIAGKHNKWHWLLFGALPSFVCLIFYWKIALVIAFGVAFWLAKNKTEDKEKNDE